MADFRPEKVIEIIQRAYKELAPILKRVSITKFVFVFQAFFYEMAILIQTGCEYFKSFITS